MRRRAAALSWLALAFIAATAGAAREPVLKQIDLPHSYYYREMYLPQLTSGPSSVAFSPDGETLVYSMAGSLWRQGINSDTAVELTHGPGYDYQPDWSPDGRHIVFVRHDRNAIELWQLDVASATAQQLTNTGAVNLEPRYSPDGSQLAYVSTAGSGHFNLFVAQVGAGKLGAARAVVAARESKIDRYYYSTHDHTINPSWMPDGKRLLFVSNREVAYGTGMLCSVALASGTDPQCFSQEETSWRAHPEAGPDGKRVLYSSYQGRQWHQLWLTTVAGDAALPLTFGEFDITHARWSPDGKRIAYVSNETGNTSLWVHAVVGGERMRIPNDLRKHMRPMGEVRIKGGPARISVLGGDQRYYGPADRLMHADDSFDPRVQTGEVRYFHCPGECVVRVPAGEAHITAWRGHGYTPLHTRVQAASGSETVVPLTLRELSLPDWAPRSVTADLHVHMNYGGHYRHTLQTLMEQARAEDLDVIHNTIVNKEQRIPDISHFDPKPRNEAGVTVFQHQEYHTSFWGHLGLLYLSSHYLTPDFSAYRQSALTSPYPHNAAIADLARRQRALVGYVHPFDWAIVPEREKSLTNALPADVALGKVDYMEVVGFSDHKATADVWYRLLNLGFRVAAGAGTDAMANYASLRGPVGMNRVHLLTNGKADAQSLYSALKEGRTVASNGPQLAFEVEQKGPGETLTLDSGKRLRYRAALRSPVAIDHFEVVYNGRVVAKHRLSGERTHADVQGQIEVRDSGWILVRAWNEDSDPLIFDLYPYGTTGPVYLSIANAPASSKADAEYFVRWIDRVIAAAEARTDYNDAREKQDTLDYLKSARAIYLQKAQLR
jgi:TolB protein